MNTLKQAFVTCSCTAVIPVTYLYEDDVFMNRIDCHCGRKFIPRSASFGDNEDGK